MALRAFWLATACAAALASPALAEQKPSPKPPAAAPKPSDKAVEGVTVTGTAPPVRTSIDRKSYSVANDLQAQTGSIGDALRNIPSVEVDVQGNVSLRGDPNVTIMIDGKPSGMFRGEGKAQALQSLPADQIDRVEVITNPSAAFNPEGTAGIINLVTKKTAKPGFSGSARLNVGDRGRQNGGVSLRRKEGRFTTSGDLYLRHDSLKQDLIGVRQFADPAGGGALTETRRSAIPGAVEVVTARAGVDFDPDAKTRISGELRYQGFNIETDRLDVLDRINAAGARVLGYDTRLAGGNDRDNLSAELSYRKKWGEDHELVMSFTRELNTDDRGGGTLRQFRVPLTPFTFEDSEGRNRLWRTQAKIDFSKPLGGGTKLKLGYEFDGDDNDYALVFARSVGGAALAIDPTRSNLFKFDQQVHALYATYERPFGKLTALAGLRLESTQIDLNQVTQAAKDHNDYVRLYPSLHLSYPLSDAQQLSASYSRRVQRPDPQAYNAFRAYFDPTNFGQGNPDLKPQVTDSFEAGYQYRKRGQIYLATLYYRDARDAVNDVVRDLGGGVILSTKANVGSFRSAGLELVASGRLPGRITYNLSGNLLWAEIDATGLGFGAGKRSALTEFGRGSLNWQATSKDFLQLQGFVNGKRLNPQGYNPATAVLNLGYRHKFDEKLSGVVTVQDLLGSFRYRNIVETAAYRETLRVVPRNRAIFVGVSYLFGGGRQRDPGFDFGQGGGSPPG